MDFRDRLPVERFRYYRGQALEARDLRGQLEVDAALQAWHDRALHGAYGVAFGLAVSEGAAGHVEVSPGAAYDASGRLLLLQRVRRLALPAAQAQQGPWLLAARFRSSDEFPSRRLLAGACPSCGSPLLEEAPALAWAPEKTFEHGPAVPLARAISSAGNPALDPDYSAPFARPRARPHIASGATLPGQGFVPWRPGRLQLGLQIQVDTSVAGFTATPHYLAWLVNGNAPQRSRPSVLLLTHVTQATPTGFLFRILLLADATFFPATPLLRQVRVAWFGCEERTPPALTLPPACTCCSGERT